MGEGYAHLNDWDRTRLMAMKADGESVRAIARTLSRSPSTISREFRRNGHNESYSASLAGERAKARRKGRAKRLAKDPGLFGRVSEMIKKGWSPQQISGRLARMHGKDSPSYVSHETIYAHIYAMPRGELRRELVAALRQSRKTRRPRSRGKDRRGQIPDLVPISERPKDAESRLVPGHWEGDLIKGKGNKSSVGTLVERTSRYLIMAQLDDATSPVVVKGFERGLKPVPPELLLSLAYDRGKEMAGHKALTESLNLRVYFADPHSPWQRGTNENANGLIRQYLPKGEDLAPYGQADLNQIADRLNERPRKCLDFQTPKEVFLEITKNNALNNPVALLP